MAAALTLITGLQHIYTCSGGEECSDCAILIGGGQLLALLGEQEAAALFAACRPTVLDAEGASLCQSLL